MTVSPTARPGQAIEPLLVDIAFDEIDARTALAPGDYTATLTLVKISDGDVGDVGGGGAVARGGENVTLGSVVQNITRMDDAAARLARDETVIRLTSPLSIAIDTPAKGGGGCSRMTADGAGPAGRLHRPPEADDRRRPAVLPDGLL